MKKYVITGGNSLKGSLHVSGAKNVALKALVASCLTDEEVVIHNMPLISDVRVMARIIEIFGGSVKFDGHTATVSVPKVTNTTIPLDIASHARASVMFISPLLARTGRATVPNPGGCRLGARPVDRIVAGIDRMNATVKYRSEDGYFHAETDGLKGIDYTFEKNTHTGTETLIIAAATAEGKTVLKNAAEEPEIDDLIGLLNGMGANITRSGKREITIEGVERLHGTTFTISPDRNEIVTFAIAAYVTKGDIFIKDADKSPLDAFLEKLDEAGAKYEKSEDGIRFYHTGNLKAVDVTTDIHPGFMTDWQAPWAVLMTQADGTSIIHETVFENKLEYVFDLKKMGAHMKLFNPDVIDRESVYNFNINDDRPWYYHAVEIQGPTRLHDAIVTMHNIRAGAAVVLAALAAHGETIVHGVNLVERGYEHFDERLAQVGAEITVVDE
jgi:UDP-N-acetylglucosamine 1-carboxyvinyltransferase